MFTRRAALGSLVALAASGCTTVNMDPMGAPAVSLSPAEAYERRLALLAALDGWQVRGRMALDTADDNVNAGVRWKQEGERYVVGISNPLGQTLAQLDGEPGSVRLRTAEGEEQTARTPERLLASMTGLSLPVSALRHWLLARPDPSVAVDVLDTDDEGRPLAISQSGWQIEYSRYSSIDGVDLPLRVDLVRDEVKAKLVLRGWQA